MGYRLNWDDNNLAEDGHRVYRSTSEMDPNNLPEPLAVLGPDVTTYEDTTAEEGTVYHYRVSAFKGESEAVSAEVVAEGDDPGPGPGPELPTEIGEEFGGGYYIGNLTIAAYNDDPGGEFAIIMGGPESQFQGQWKTSDTDTPNSASASNGLANTLAQEAAGLADHPAAEYCLGHTGGGHSDWYLPAMNELNLAWVNRAELADLAMGTHLYWSSTQYSGPFARTQLFSNGSQSFTAKSYSYRVRPVRRLKI